MKFALLPLQKNKRPWQGHDPVDATVFIPRRTDNIFELRITASFTVRRNGQAPAYARLYCEDRAVRDYACTWSGRITAGKKGKPNTLTLTQCINVEFP